MAKWTRTTQTSLTPSGGNIRWRKIGGQRGQPSPYLVQECSPNGLPYFTARLHTQQAADALLHALLWENESLCDALRRRIQQAARHGWTDRDDEDWATMTGIYAHDRELV